MVQCADAIAASTASSSSGSASALALIAGTLIHEPPASAGRPGIGAFWSVKSGSVVIVGDAHDVELV